MAHRPTISILHNAIPPPGSERTGRSAIDREFDLSRPPAAYARAYLTRAQALLQRVDEQEVERVILALLDARDRGRAIFIFGNGGSASIASHFANDLALGAASSAPPFRAMSLVENVAALSAAANDAGYDQVFVKQLEPWVQSGDVAIGLSASGNSPNVLNGIRFARDRGARTVGFTAFPGGALMALADLSIHAACEPGEYGAAEDLFMLFEHLICDYVRLRTKDEAPRDVPPDGSG
jgi:D-sedoheptulose 7-phosphate isomerase